MPLFGFDWAQARQWREELRQQGNVLAFTNGVFDILHAGHLESIRRAREMGDALIMGINSDSSVRRIKGPKRPIINQDNRAALLLGLKWVDAVVFFDEDTPAKLIEKIVPDVLVKGGDYTPETVVGRDTVEAHGGRVEIIPLVPGLSTSTIVDTIVDRYGK